MLKFIQSSENINSNGGFSLVCRLLDHNDGMLLWDQVFPARHNSVYSTSVIVRSAIGMMTAGYSNFSDVEKLRSDSLFGMLTGGGDLSRPCTSTRVRPAIWSWAAAHLSSTSCHCLVASASSRWRSVSWGLVVLDIDVSVLEDTASHKEGVAMSYHKVNGYAPIFACSARHHSDYNRQIMLFQWFQEERPSFHAKLKTVATGHR